MYKSKPLVISYPDGAPADEQATLRFRMWTTRERKEFWLKMAALGETVKTDLGAATAELGNYEEGLFSTLLLSAEGLEGGTDLEKMPAEIVNHAAGKLRDFLGIKKTNFGLGIAVEARDESRPPVSGASA